MQTTERTSSKGNPRHGRTVILSRSHGRCKTEVDACKRLLPEHLSTRAANGLISSNNSCVQHALQARPWRHVACACALLVYVHTRQAKGLAALQGSVRSYLRHIHTYQPVIGSSRNSVKPLASLSIEPPFGILSTVSNRLSLCTTEFNYFLILVYFLGLCISCLTHYSD